LVVNELRISAVSFLNTSPLVWGLTHGPLDGRAEIWFEVPSACAASVAGGVADVGIIPVIEMARQGLPAVPGLGIASDGDVRSIYLISHVPAEEIRSLAVDTSSRTSVGLARVILARKYDVRPRTIPYPPNVEKMLTLADAALVIGDPALRLAPQQEGYHIYDLGREWTEMTGLPMVYAMWAGKGAAEASELLQESYAYGRERIDEIVASEAAPRNIPAELARSYLTRNIVFELGERHMRGLELYLSLALHNGHLA
jgi:predicted solute-binding protein